MTNTENPSPETKAEGAISSEAALRLAIYHIEHMAAYFSSKNLGYSFEALGEDLPGIKETLTSVLSRTPDLAIAGNGLKQIVEKIDGAMTYGTWRSEKTGARLKDTPEWVAFYNALAAVNREAGEP